MTSTSGNPSELESVLDQDFSAWVGKTRVRRDTVSAWPAQALAATLDRDPRAFAEGVELPHGWHWMYFNDAVPASGLGEDGHEARGGFLPPIPLPRRMWAGGRIRFHEPVRIGEVAERTSEIERVRTKRGRSGPLVFVTVRHRIVGSAGLAVDEEQDLVYRAPSGKGAVASPEGDGWSAPEGTEIVGRFQADPVTLFRFSALTFNGHRIHYDRPYATEVEGYPDLVVHGPLLALLLLDAAEARTGQSSGIYHYRALAPIFCHEPCEICAAPESAEEGSGVKLWAAHPRRGPAMEAELR
ncbi:MAG: MaoC family dehydratase N-terminal domain-containing protein [Gemmatimonadota bacterium]|nr:MaoC family dehydratase N-terminal domain-containing protein [Gemmatimonadota bacterium]